jgi:predicted Rossmann fold flavoprotein
MKVQKDKYCLAVIGAGPAGMTAAISASERGARVILIEKNRSPGKKLLMTGKDRCNITNAEADTGKFAEAFGKNGKFLLSALHRFGVEDTISFFHRNGVRTKIERGNRVFPESDRSKDVQELLLRLIKKRDITLLAGSGVKKIVHSKDSIEKLVIDKGEIKAENYLVCTGGLSYPLTGSTGDGYQWAREMGHSIVKPGPALTPVLVKEKWVKDLEGLSLRNVRISVYQNNKKRDDRFGEALFTFNGLSGPIVLDMSKAIGNLLAGGRVDMLIDFKPALAAGTLDRRILRDIESNRNRSVKNILAELLPKKLIPVILELSKIDSAKRGNAVTKEERRKLRILLKEFPLTIKGLLGFNKAIITTGGINLKEVDPKSMRSRIIKNLYFAGEVLDLDGPTGGYNLQVCWSTGHLAGESAAHECNSAEEQ